MTDEIKLKPCPFCGSTNQNLFTFMTYAGDTKYGFFLLELSSKRAASR